MQPPLRPPDEAARQAALLEYRILDTQAERVFDEVAELAAVICGTDFGFVTLIDGDRQWFKAVSGLDPRPTQGPRDESICGHAILERETFEVPDTHADARFAGNPTLERLGLRFYGGQQLMAPSGHAIGMLCVAAQQPRQLSAAQRRALSHLGELVMALLESRKREFRMHWLGSLLDAIDDEILIIEPLGFSYLHANAGARRALGYTLEELLRMSPRDVNVSVDGTSFEALRERALAGDAVRFSGERRRKDGRTYPFECRWHLATLGAETVVISVVQDVTERRKLERMKDEFVSTVNHELRTPLTSIRGPLALLHRGALGALPPKAAGMVALAHESTERLVRLVDDILDLEKASTGNMRFEFEPVEAAPFLEALAASLRPRAEESRVRLTVDAPAALFVRADRHRLMQVVGNLLSNALKFAPEGTEVALRVAREQGEAVMSVVDHGPGVPEEFKPKVFQRFAQASGAGRGGTGLGLSIVKTLAEKMGGRVGFESRAGETRFWVALPLEGASA